MYYIDLGSKVKALRLEKKMTQAQLAERLGITKSVISAYENSSRYPSYDILIKLATILGVTTDYLLGMNDRRYVDITSVPEAYHELIRNLIEILQTK